MILTPKLSLALAAVLSASLSFSSCDCGEAPSACGDGTVGGAEECDDGNTNDGDGCDSACASETPPPDPACGDGSVDAAEECDDGNVDVGDGCDSTCQLEPACGDGSVDAGEECDDGNVDVGDGCDAACQLEPACGDDTVDAGEECDDGNRDAGDGCDDACALEGGPGCGNGTLDANEECDDANFSAGDGCEADCTTTPALTCGDGSLDANEQCDDSNTTNGDGCAFNCLIEAAATCGNGVFDPGEQCDDANTTGGDGCSFNCLTETASGSVCGDGIFDAGEQCDDANTSSGDGCAFNCVIETVAGSVCGDGIFDPGEQCDDANTVGGDGCAFNCVIEAVVGGVCGDGIFDVGEQCDDANTVGGDGCAFNCVIEAVLGGVCGDGVFDAGEQCDDANTNNGDGCAFNCVIETAPGGTCGDGVFDVGEQCDDANTIGGDGCAFNCLIEAPTGATCGDNVVDVGEQCDDGNIVSGDGCAFNCTVETVVGSTCGNSIIEAGEQCDDGNVVGGDGCAFNCIDEGGNFDVVDSDPHTVSRVTGANIILIGEGFLDAMSVVLQDCFDAANPDFTLEVGLPSNGTSVTVVLPADLTLSQSLYRFAAVNGDGQEDTTDCILVISALAPPTISDVAPPFAFAGIGGDGVNSDATVRLTGSGFVPTPAVTFVSSSDSTKVFQSPIVGFVSDSELSVVAPSETQRMPLGTYFVFVTNPDGLQAQFLVDDGSGNPVPGTFDVRDVPPPDIVNIDPLRDPGTSDVPLTLTGASFVDGAVVSLLLDDQGNEVALPTVFVSNVELNATVSSGAVGDGIYPVKVTNPDGQTDFFFVYEQTNSSEGHLNQDAFIDTLRRLEVGRERHGAVEGFDVAGQAHLYVIGGMDDQKTILGSVERAQVSIFGNAAAFETVQQYGVGSTDDGGARVPSLLNTPRAGLSVVRAGNFLYAIGGTTDDPIGGSDTGALKSIESARILGFETQPAITEPQVRGGNGLANGTWFYRVSQVTGEGESLASREVSAQGGGVIRVCWSSPNGAQKFNLYRSLAADGRFNTTRLIRHEVQPVPDQNGVLCVDDNGGNDVANGVFLTPAPGRLAGTLISGGALNDGVFSYRVSAVRDGVETVAGYATTILVDGVNQPDLRTVTLRWDVIPGATYNLYRSENANDVAGSEKLLAAGFSSNSFTDDGSETFADDTVGPREGVAVLPTGSLTRWRTLAIELTQAREGPDAVVLTAFDGDNSTASCANANSVDCDRTFLYVGGGKTAHRTGTYLRTTERALVDATSGNLVNPVDAATLTLAEDTTHLMASGRAYFPLLTNQGQFVTPFPPPPAEPPCGDVDGDGHPDFACGGDDCDDTNPNIHPGADEACTNGIDDDCDTFADCADPDAAPAGCAAEALCSCNPGSDVDGDEHLAPPCGDDCNDNDANVHPGTEAGQCTNGIDNDCDLLVDCDDVDCAADPTCQAACEGLVDGDGDGVAAPPCGDDCNDLDPSIFVGAPEVQCDGIDQDCSGADSCISALSTGFSSGGVVVLGGAAPSTTLRPLGSVNGVPETTDAIFLVACSGDTNFVASNNRGSSNFEVSGINPLTGELTGWVIQSEPSISGQGVFGHDALLYFNFVFSFPGVSSESLTQEPSPDSGTVSRFPFNQDSSDPALVMDKFQSASAKLTVPRSYYALVRVNARIFAVGGNNGSSGATNLLDVHQQ